MATTGSSIRPAPSSSARQSREAADAEILAAALDALEATGLKETSVEIGDVDIRNAFIDQLPVSERSKTRIRRIALRTQKETHFISPASAQESADADKTDEFGELASLLASVEPGKAELLIKEVFALADVRHVGGRTPEEIVERLISRTAQQAEPISAELMQGVLDLLKIRAKPEAAFKAIRDHFREFKIAAIEPILERCETRLALLQRLWAEPGSACTSMSDCGGAWSITPDFCSRFLQRTSRKSATCAAAAATTICWKDWAPTRRFRRSGSASASIGCFWRCRRPKRLRATRARPRRSSLPREKRRHAECIRVSALLREAGWSVELELSNRGERDALAYAAKHDIPYVVFVGDDKAKKGALRVRRLDERTDRHLAFADLQAYARRESAAVAEGKKP